MKGPGYFLSKIFYGTYSSKFNRYCQQKDIPTPYKLCYHDDPDHHIYEVLFRNDKYKSLLTRQAIEFERTAFYTQRKKILKKYRSIYGYSIMDMDHKTLRVYCYRKDLFGHRVKFLYYFLDHDLIMGEYIFLAYSAEKVNAIAQDLIKQFKLDYTYNNENFYIENENSERIMFMDTGFDLNIRYFSSKNTDIIAHLHNYFINEVEETKPENTEWKRVGE